MTKPAITILYSCDLCGLKDVKIAVAARDDDSDIMIWMDSLIRKIAADHSHRSPRCKAVSISSVNIPIDDDTCIGGPPKPPAPAA